MAGRFSIEAIFSAHDNVSKTIARLEKNASGFSAGLKKDFGGLGKSLSTMGAGIAQIAKVSAVAGGALAGLAGAGIVSVMTASNDVGDSLGKVASIIEPMSGTVVDATARMKSAAMDWSKSHLGSAKAFIDTSYQMLSAGLNEQQAVAATRSAITLATAAMGDNTQAAQLLATLYNNMGDKLKDPQKEFAHLADVVAQTQAVFQFSNFDALNQGLKYAVPSALQFGMSLEQVSTALGMLNNAGLQESQAGTSFAASMSKMIKASHELGFSIAKTASGGVDFGATLVNMHNKLGPVAKMTDTAKLSLQKAFGEEGVRAIALMVDNASDFNTQLAKVSKNADVAALATATIERAGSAPFKIMMQRWENAKVAMGDALTPVLSPMIDGVGKVVDTIGNWVTANKDLISGGVQQAISAVVPIVKVFGESFIEALPAIKSAVGMLFTGFGSGAHWVEVAKSGARILGQLAAGAIAVAAVFGGALAAGFELAVDLSNDVIGGWNGMINTIGGAVFAVDNFLSNLGARWRAFKFSDLATYLIDGLVNGIKNGAQWVIDAASNLGQQAIDGIKKSLGIHSPSREFAKIGDMSALGVTNGITAGIPDAVRASQSMADQVMGAMAIKAPGAFTGPTLAGIGGLDQSWLPRVNARTLGTDQMQAPATGGNASPSVVLGNNSDDARLEMMLQRVFQSGNAGGAVITVRAGKGSSAEVTEQPKAGGSTLRVEPSGGM